MVLSRIAAEEEARTTREIRAAVDPDCLDLPSLLLRFAATTPFGGGASRELVLHCSVSRTFDLVQALVAAGATDVTVRTLDYVFRPTNPFAERLLQRIGSVDQNDS